MQFKLTVVSATGLYKKDMFRLPDPFAVITVNGEQTHSTSVVKKTLNPYWNESFEMQYNPGEILTIQLFDQKKWKKDKNQVRFR
jgi:E3 ubiquitin-protein ligase NEDD4